MREKIQSALIELDLDEEKKHIELFIQYIDQLINWNKAYNLTALRNKQDILVQHLFDCLTIIPILRRKWPNNNKKIIDIGSGAGLPGVIIAICQPHWHVACIDAVGKKSAFVKQVKGILGLKNLDSIHGRIESVPNLDADLIISRAFASLNDFVNLSSAHLNPGGNFLAMKGHFPELELNELNRKTDWRLIDKINLSVPFLKAERCLLVIGKK